MTDSVESVLQNSREEFEKWGDTQKFPPLMEDNARAYWWAWEGWQASRSALEPMLAELREQIARLESCRVNAHLEKLEDCRVVAELRGSNEKLRELLRRINAMVSGEAQDNGWPIHPRVTANRLVIADMIGPALSPSPTPAPDTNTQSLCRAKLSPDYATPAQDAIFIWSCSACRMRIQTVIDFHINQRPVCVQCNAEMEPDKSFSATPATDELLGHFAQLIDSAAEKMPHDEFMQTAKKAKATLDQAIAALDATTGKGE